MCHHAMQFSPDLEAPTCRIRDLATLWIAELQAGCCSYASADEQPLA